MNLHSVVTKIISAFFALFPTPQAQFEKLWAVKGDAGCPRCGGSEYISEKEGRVRRCTNKKCWHPRSVTAGTWLHKVHNVEKRLLSLWLKFNGINLNANQIKSVLTIAYGAAWLGEHSIRWLKEKEITEPFKVVLSNFAEIIGRRTVQTPAHQHPVAELIEMCAATEDCDAKLEQFLASSWQEFAPTDINVTILESESSETVLPHESEDPGPEAPSSHTSTAGFDSICKISDWLRNTFQSVSVKYLQLYLAHILLFIPSLKEQSFDDVLKKILKSTPFGLKQLKAYSSQRQLKFVNPIRLETALKPSVTTS